MEAGDLLKNTITKDIFNPIAKIIIGLISYVELYYLFIDRFTITPALITGLTKISFNFIFILIALPVLFILGYISCLIGIVLLNLFVNLTFRLFKKELAQGITPIDPFREGFRNETPYSKHMLQVVGDYLNLKYQLVGNEFFRLSKIVAFQNENIFNRHVLNFDTNLRRGLFFNSILFVAITYLTLNIYLILAALLILVVIYNANREITVYWRELIYDLAFFTASKASGKK